MLGLFHHVGMTDAVSTDPGAVPMHLDRSGSTSTACHSSSTSSSSETASASRAWAKASSTDSPSSSSSPFTIFLANASMMSSPSSP